MKGFMFQEETPYEEQTHKERLVHDKCINGYREASEKRAIIRKEKVAQEIKEWRRRNE